METINKLLELKEFLTGKELTSCITGDDYIPTLYCNGFSIRHKNGSYKVDNLKNPKLSSHIPDCEQVFDFITNGFHVKVNRTDFKKIMNCLSFRNVSTKNNLLRKICGVYILTERQRRKISKIIKNNPSMSKAWLAQRIMEVAEKKGDLIPISKARQELRDMIPKEFPAYCNIHIPVDKHEMINNIISVRDFFLLNVLYEYPAMLFYCYNRRGIRGTIPYTVKVMYSPAVNTRNLKKKLPSTFWSDMEPYRDKIFDDVMTWMTSHELPKTRMSHRGFRILQQIASFYGLKCVDTYGINPVWSQELISYLRGNRGSN